MGEVEFFNFVHAFPAIEGCSRVSAERRLDYLNMISRGKAPSREEQEIVFPDMARRMREKIGDNYWTLDGVKRYWFVEHNKIIDNREAGYEKASGEHCDVCKAHVWRVRDVLKDGRVGLLENKKGDTIMALNYRNLELGDIDYVSVHKRNISAVVDFEDYEKYG